MNILVVAYNGQSYYFRPDTTLEKESKDYYCPDDIDSLALMPCLYIKISKAGKCIEQKFAHRYYDSIGAGILLYDYKIPNDPYSFCMATAMDHTTILSRQTVEPSLMGEVAYRWLIDGAVVTEWRGDVADNDRIADYLDSKVELVSRHCSLRIGDIIILELSTMKGLGELPVNANLSLTNGNQTLLNFNIC